MFKKLLLPSSIEHILKAEQMALFDMPVLIHGSVKRDGTVIKPHIGIRKKRIDHPHTDQSDLFGHTDDDKIRMRRHGLEAILKKYGGANQVALMLSSLEPIRRQDVIAKMAKIAKISTDDFEVALSNAKPSEAPQLDIFGIDDNQVVEPVTEFTPTHL